MGWSGAEGQARGMRGFWGEVLAKTQGLYQVLNWNYGQKTKKKLKKGGQVGAKGVPGGSGGGQGQAGVMRGFWGEVLAKTAGLYLVPKLRNLNMGKF